MVLLFLPKSPYFLEIKTINTNVLQPKITRDTCVVERSWVLRENVYHGNKREGILE